MNYSTTLMMVFGLTGCAAKTPPSGSTQERVAPLAEKHENHASDLPGDHSAHVHSEPPPNNATPPADAVPQPVVSDEMAAFAKAKPIFEKYCAKCHTEASGKRAALKHFVMDSYPFGGHHADSMPATIRNVLGQSGKQATMPKGKPGVVVGDELKLILEWADATERAASGKKQRSDGHDHQH